MTSEFALEASGLVVNRGGRRILDVPLFQAAPGEVLAIIGPNGSGKTTLIQCLALLLKPDTGTISYNSRRITNGRSALYQRRRLAVVFQTPLLLRGAVRDNVSLGLRLRGFSQRETTIRVNRWLERFDIDGLAARPAATLSSGEAQRTSLARAFALEPDVIFLDEPFAALDAPTRQSLNGKLIQALHETRTTAVMVTHDRNEALALGDRVAVLMDGQVRQTGAPQTVFTQPVDEAVAAFVGIENIIPGAILEQNQGIALVSIADGMVLEVVSALAVGIPVAVCLRPEDITLSVSREPAVPTSARNRLSGRVADVIPLGAQTRVIIDCDHSLNLSAIITTRSQQELGLLPGLAVTATFKASSAHLVAVR